MGLAAEEGFYFRFNSLFKNEYEWQRLLDNSANQSEDEIEWMEIVEELMAHYVDKTDGACIEKKECSIVFDFADTDL